MNEKCTADTAVAQKESTVPPALGIMSNHWAILVFDPDFLAIADGIVTRIVELYQPDRTWVTTIREWFGPRWVGFEGKLCGLAGVRPRVRDGMLRLTVPPFHPHRVFSCFKFKRSTEGGYILDCFDDLHGHRTSEANTRRMLLKTSGTGVYVWISSSFVENRASLMVYFVEEEGDTAWYLGFEKKSDWKVSEQVGVSVTELEAIATPHKSALAAGDTVDRGCHNT